MTGCREDVRPFHNRFNCLMVTPEVMAVGYGELPRSERKSQRVSMAGLPIRWSNRRDMRNRDAWGAEAQGLAAPWLHGCSSSALISGSLLPHLKQKLALCGTLT